MKIRSATPLVAVVLLCIACMWTPTASAAIVVGQGIAGVKLGDSQSRVKQLLGKPDYTQAATKTSGPVWGYPGQPFQGRIAFDHKTHRVQGMWTGSKKQRTNKGIGPGSSLSKTKKAYPGAKCSTGPFGPTSVICLQKSSYKGKTAKTSFVFASDTLGMREIDIDA